MGQPFNLYKLGLLKSNGLTFPVQLQSESHVQRGSHGVLLPHLQKISDEALVCRWWILIDTLISWLIPVTFWNKALPVCGYSSSHVATKREHFSEYLLLTHILWIWTSLGIFCVVQQARVTEALTGLQRLLSCCCCRCCCCCCCRCCWSWSRPWFRCIATSLK